MPATTVAVLGAGNIGGNIARRLAGAGHSLTLSFARDQDALRALADQIGAQVATPAEAASRSEVVVISVPWGALLEALAQAGSLAGKVVIDTTNQFGPGPHPADGQTAAAFNAARMPGARYTKSFNTLTAAFQVATADRPDDQRIVQWLCGDDDQATSIVARLIEDAGYVPVNLGGVDGCAVMEAPRRPGAVYGEEWRLSEAQSVAQAVRDGRPIPATPHYGDRSG
jgi:8-hydroxy-5-deazaflavin:NADPH oxidoreductase